MSARTWQPHGGDGAILDRVGEPDDGPAIRAYADETSWEVTAESPFGAITMAKGLALSLDDAQEQAQTALMQITGEVA